MIYQPHPIANILPLMSGPEFVELKEDIRANGCLEPITLFEGRILDGRNRFKACQEVGVKPEFVEYQGADPVAFVVSLNLKRRHLDAAQRALVAARLADMPQGHRTDKQPSANLQNVPPISQPQAADMLNVSTRSVATAAKVDDEAPRPVVDAVEKGLMSLNLAVQVVELPEDQQEIVASVPVEQMRDVAREVVHNHRAQGTGENEWYTPDQYVDAAREFLGGIDLDPASSEIAQRTVKAKSFFTAEHNGLDHPWNGKIWLNPPYSQPAIQQFMQKTVDEYSSGRMTEGIALTHNYTDTQWFHLAAKSAEAICFTRGRIGFLSPEGKKAAPTQGQAFFYFGNRPQDFADYFCQFGFVLVKP